MPDPQEPTTDSTTALTETFLMSLHTTGGSFSEAIQPIFSLQIKTTSEEDALTLANNIHTSLGDEDLIVQVTPLVPHDENITTPAELRKAFQEAHDEYYGD